MYSVVISLSCGISPHILITLLEMLLLNNNTLLFLYFFPVRAGVRSWRCTIWWPDSVECTLPRALVLFSPVCVWCNPACENARGHFKSNKRPDKMLSERKRKLNFRCSCENTELSVKRSRPGQSFSLALSFFSSPFLSPSVTLADSLWLYSTS